MAHRSEEFRSQATSRLMFCEFSGSLEKASVSRDIASHLEILVAAVPVGIYLSVTLSRGVS